MVYEIVKVVSLLNMASYPFFGIEVDLCNSLYKNV